jgi:hypothetical protein
VRLYSCGALHSYSRKRIPPRPLTTVRVARRAVTRSVENRNSLRLFLALVTVDFRGIGVVRRLRCGRRASDRGPARRTTSRRHDVCDVGAFEVQPTTPRYPPVSPLANAADYERQRAPRSVTEPVKTHEVGLQSLSRRTFRTLRTALSDLLQLPNQLFDALQRTTLVNRHPNLLKALSAPRVS